jgi:penicillin amidase
LVLIGCAQPGDGKPGAGPPGNVAPVDIAIDDLGIPHLYAESDKDLFHAAGYQMATDRLYQAQMLRRFAHGRLTEVLGETALLRDQQARIFDLAALGAADAEWMATNDPERADLLRLWVSGINRRIDEIHDGSVPLPFGFGPDHYDFLPERWTDTDPYVVLKGANLAIDMTLEFEIAVTLVDALYGDLLDEVDLFRPGRDVFSLPESERPIPAMRPPAATGRAARLPGLTHISAAVTRALSSLPHAQGSNNWAVDGRHTASGRALLAGDPHLAFDFFGAPYPLHMNSKAGGGTYDVAGFAFPGTPGIALGHTDRVAWSATSSFADVMDAWMVTREGDGVRIGETVVAVDAREETFIVRGTADSAGEGETVTLVYEDIPDIGVVLPGALLPLPVGDFVVSWMGMRVRRASWFLELNRADSIDSFESAVDRMTEMNYNLVGASADGIAYRVGIDVPDRGGVGGANTPWQAMDGDEPSTWWTGELLAPEQLPASRSPERGWIATANNDPFGFSKNGHFDDDPWYYGSLYAPGYRAQRIHTELERLTNRGEVTAADMTTLQLDTHSTLADDLLPLLAAAHGRIATDPALADFADEPDLDAFVALLTEDWDRRMVRESPAALAFHAFLHRMTEAVLADDMALAYDMAMELKSVFIIKMAVLCVQGAFPDADVVQDGVDRTLLTAALATASWLVDRFGAVDAVPFGELKTTRFDHALGYGIALGDLPTDGGEDTINVGQDIATDPDSDTWFSTHVSAERMVVGFGADGVPEARVNFPFASLADPDSEESRSAMMDYVNEGYQTLPFRAADVEVRTVDSSVLAPY